MLASRMSPAAAPRVWITRAEPGASATTAVFKPQLAQVKPRGQPTQHKSQRQANENPANLQVHQALVLMGCKAGLGRRWRAQAQKRV
jgi:hypothetical protein